MSEALILNSINSQYDERLFIELPEKYMLCANIVLNVKTKQNKKINFCTQHVLNLYFLGNSMDNILSNCGLSDARMRASEKDLLVQLVQLTVGI